MSNDEQGGPYAPAPMVHELVAKITGRYDLVARQHEADRLLAAEGAGHIVHDLPVRADGRTVSLASRPWRLDPIPIVIDAAEFHRPGRPRRRPDAHARGDPRRPVRRPHAADRQDPRTGRRVGVVPVPPRRDRPARRATLADHVFGRRGQGHVGQLARRAGPHRPAARRRLHVHGPQRARPSAPRRRSSALPRGAGLRSIDPFADQLRDALADLAKTESPRIVVMSGGVEHPSFVGQAYLASRLGLNLAEGADLVVRKRRLWLRSLAGLEPIDVLHRRLEGDRIDPMEVNARRRRWRARPARRRPGRRRPAGQRPRHRRARRPGARRVLGRRGRLDRRPAPAVAVDVEPLRRLSRRAARRQIRVRDWPRASSAARSSTGRSSCGCNSSPPTAGSR